VVGLVLLCGRARLRDRQPVRRRQKALLTARSVPLLAAAGRAARCAAAAYVLAISAVLLLVLACACSFLRQGLAVQPVFHPEHYTYGFESRLYETPWRHSL